MHRVLLTGGTGFLGAYIARLLVKANYEVYAIHRPSSSFDLVENIYDRINWIECDLHDIMKLDEVISGVDGIIHCAAMVSFQSADINQMYRVNVEATHDLVNLALEHEVKKFVYISSIAALGRTKKTELLDEKTEWIESPENSYYGISKHLGEQEVWRGHAEGLNMVILNPSLIIGAGQFDDGTPAFIKRQDQGNPFYPTGATGFVDVRDVARYTLSALNSNLNGERFIISNTNCSYYDFLNLLSKSLDKKAPRIALNQIWASIFSSLDIIKSFITRSKRLVSKENILAASRVTSYANTKSMQLDNKDYITLEKTISDLSKAYLKAKEKGLSYGILPHIT